MGPFFIFLAALGYATVALFGRWIFDEHLPMYTVLTWRFGGAALLFGALSRFEPKEPIPFQRKWACFLMGLCVDVLQTSVFFFCIARLGASLAALLLYTFPFFVFLIQRFVFQEQATARQWICLLISLFGCCLVIDPFQQGEGVPIDSIGMFFGVASGMIYAFYLSLGAHFTQGISPIASARYLTSGAFMGFASIAFFRKELAFPIHFSEWGLALLIVLIATVLPLLSLVKGMQIVGATRASLLFTFEPIATILLAIFFFGESLTLAHSLGSLCILSSALLIQRGKKAESSTF